MMANNFYKSLLYHSPTGYAYHKIIFDEKGEVYDYEFLDVNPAFENLTGFKAEQVVGRRATQVLPMIGEEDFDWVDFYGEITITGGCREFTQYSKELNRWYRIKAYSPKKDHFVTYFNNISQEIEQIKELDTFFQVSPDLLCIIDQDYKLVKVNKAWERQLGYQMNELAGMKFLALVYPGDREFTQKLLASIIEQQKEVNFVIRYCTINNYCRHIDWRAQAHGNLIYMAARDITDKLEEQKATEKLVECSEEFLQMTANKIDYQKIVEYLLEIAEAQYAVFGFYDAKKEIFETMAIAGYPKPLKKSAFIANHDFIGKRWGQKPKSAEGKMEDIMTIFPSEAEAINSILAETDVSCLTKKDNTGEAVLVKIMRDGIVGGCFYFAMPLGKTFKNKNKIEIFIRQVGLLFARIQAEKDVSNQKGYFEALFLNTTDAMLYFDDHARVFNINERFTQLFGYELKNLKGTDVNRLFKLSQASGELVSHKILKGETVAMETIRYTKEGRALPVLLKGGPIHMDGQITGGYAVYTDITEQKAYEEQLKQLSILDQLTGLYNRNFFETEIKMIEKDKHYPISIVSCDVDGLKIVNDNLGHDCGDKLLQIVANVLSRSFRGTDILARVGGDEFVAILPNTDEETAERIAQRIRDNIVLASKESEEFPVSLSVGTATALSRTEPLSEVFKKADDRMYHEKFTKKGSTVTQNC